MTARINGRPVTFSCVAQSGVSLIRQEVAPFFGSLSALPVTVPLSVVDLALTISDLVDCPFDSLKVLCNSLGFHLTFEMTRIELLQLLSARRRTLTEHSSYSIETCFHGFEKLSKADLLSLAAAHGMSPVGSLDHIKSMITDHILKGQCMTPVRS